MRWICGNSERRVVRIQRRWQRVEQHLTTHPTGVPQAEVVQHHPANIAGRDRALFVAEGVVDERMAILCEGGDVVKAIGGKAAFTVAAQIRHDYLETGSDQRLDIAPPDAFGFGITMDQQQRIAADAFANEREFHVVANGGELGCELVRIRRSHQCARVINKRVANRRVVK